MNALEMKNITKTFGSFIANDNISLEVKKGEVLALLGENGAGKSTLMNILFGLYTSDSGSIFINGEKVEINSPLDADAYNIGMVHQHFQLVDVFSVAENIVLGEKGNKYLSTKKASVKIKEISKKLNLEIDPSEKISNITVGMQQRVEIIKMLYKDSDILIFDEPTAVLTPQEIVEFGNIIKTLKDSGKAIILITHKLKEIKTMADRCTIIRKGKCITSLKVEDVEEDKLAELMVGRKVSFETKKIDSNPTEDSIVMDNLIVENNIGVNKVDGFSLTVKKGEIVGIAGIDGNGQDELIEAITGLREVKSGSIKYDGKDFTNKSAKDLAKNHIANVPSDRQKYGIVSNFPFYESMIMHTYFDKDTHPGFVIDYDKAKEYSEKIIAENDVRTSKGVYSRTGGLSGGNQQKAIVGRELELSPNIIIASQPTRGIDVGAIEHIHQKLIDQRDAGKAVLVVSYELEEIFNLADRIAVMFEGKIIGILDRADADEKKIGLLMSGKESL